MIKKKTVAILGAGFLGKNLIRRFLAAGFLIRVLDHNSCPIEFENKVYWLKSNFTNAESLAKILDTEIDVAYHMISSTVPGSEKEKRIADDLTENVFPTIEFINLAVKANVKRIVFFSSSSVYGVQEKLPISENAETTPISTHGIQKLILEKYFKFFEFTDAIEVKIVRLANPYGPGQNLNGKQGFIAIAIGALLNNSTLQIRDNGLTIRDYIYIEDVLDALEKIGFDKSVPSLLNIGSGIPYSLLEVLNIIEKFSGKTIKKQFISDRKSDIPKSILDVSFADSSIGFRAKTNLTEGIQKTLNFYGII